MVKLYPFRSQQKHPENPLSCTQKGYSYPPRYLGFFLYPASHCLSQTGLNREKSKNITKRLRPLFMNGGVS